MGNDSTTLKELPAPDLPRLDKVDVATPLESEPLFDAIDDSALLYTPTQLKAKRYTAKQISKLGQVREAVFMLLPMWPVEDIARRLGLNKRTVTALAAADTEKVARTSGEFKNLLRSTASRWLAIARSREHEASFQQLVIGLGILLDKARDLDMLGQMGDTSEKEIVKADEDRAAVVSGLRAWFDQARRAIHTNEQPTDLQTMPKALTDSAPVPGQDQRAGHGAGPSVVGAPGPGEPAGPQGGGAPARSAALGHMGELSGECSAKGPPDARAPWPGEKNAPPTQGGQP